ncbi:MAG: DUF1684 domain-containing protein [Chlorobi bacterium]|nr:DUF1684 domain-containing protein [Chlorobiota bacterium]
MTSKKFLYKVMLSGLFIVPALACNHNDKVSPDYVSEIMKLRQRHIDYLKSDTGWLNLAGLYWLDEGENSFGSDSSDKIIFPQKAPAHIGTLILDSGNVRVRITPGVVVTSGGRPVHDTLLIPDTEKGTTVLKSGPLVWFVIRRGLQTGIRLRNLEHPAVQALDTIPAWPVDPAWRIKAKFVPFSSPKKVQIPNVLGTTFESTSPGMLYFTVNRKQYSLQPTGRPEHLSLVFADETSSGRESYGGGRFLEVDGPDQKGNYYIDFNKAYNPPCAFTPYATCPLPMRENILPFTVTAGEKTDPAWHGHK